MILKNNGTSSALAIISMSLLCSCSILKPAQDEVRKKRYKEELAERLSSKARVVYCIKDIPIGAPITVRELEEREIEKSKVPQDAMTKVHDAVGHSARYAIYEGQILSQHDLGDKNETPCLVVTLSEETRKSLSDLAAKKGVSSSEMATQLVQNKLK